MYRTNVFSDLLAEDDPGFNQRTHGSAGSGNQIAHVDRTGIHLYATCFDACEIQNIVYEIGKTHEFANLRDWFRALYEVLLGEEQGPRFGTFTRLYGVRETAALIRRALAGEDLSKA